MKINTVNIGHKDMMIALESADDHTKMYVVRMGAADVIWLQPELDDDGEIALNVKDLWNAVAKLNAPQPSPNPDWTLVPPQQWQYQPQQPWQWGSSIYQGQTMGAGGMSVQSGDVAP